LLPFAGESTLVIVAVFAASAGRRNAFDCTSLRDGHYRFGVGLCRDHPWRFQYYSLQFVERSPLPPHERTWRHPSEIGPTTVEVDRGSGHRFGALATGAFAVALIAALVVTVTPGGSVNAPITASASTSPPVRAAASTAIAVAETIRSIRLVEATAIPSAIADVPAGAYRSTGSSDPEAVLPDLHDQVLVLTDQYAYSVAWSDVARLDVEGDAVVVGTNGEIVARFSDGRFIVSHDSLVGSAFAAD
jgi:hypothetical protein